MSGLLALFFFLLPTYLIRFHIGLLPTTLLEILFWIIVAVWIIQNKKNVVSHVSSINNTHRPLLIAISLFLLASTVAVFASINTRAALGEWKAFYVEPVILFFILITSIKTKKQIDGILVSLLALSLMTSLLAMYQHFTGWLVPHAFWANRDTYRVTAWYGFPNAIGLFLAPIVPLGIYLLKNKYYFLSLTTLPCMLLAMIFAKSTGGLIGTAAGLGVLLLFNKKTRLPAIAIGIATLAGLFLLPPHNSVRQEILAQDRSGQIRVAMWSEALELLSNRPILGAGLASYAQRVAPYHTLVNGEGIEIFHHPHNIFLTMWVNLGLLGLGSFILILLWFYRAGVWTTTNRQSPLVRYLIASMTTMIVTGLVDSPYIKNDLAMFFWLIPALMILTTKHYETMENT